MELQDFLWPGLSHELLLQVTGKLHSLSGRVEAHDESVALRGRLVAIVLG